MPPDPPRRDRPSAEYSLGGKEERLAQLPKLALGKAPRGPAVPPPLPPAHLPQRRPTITGVAPPAALSAPQPPVLTTARGMGPPDLGTLEPPESATAQPSVPIPWSEAKTRPGKPESTPMPPRSVSPPGGMKVDVEVGGQRVKIRAGEGLRKIAPWLAPFLLGILTSIGGAIVGYYEGLAAAGRRVAAIEEAARLNAEADTRLKKRTETELNRAFTVLDDHDARVPKLERRLDKIEAALPRVEGLPSNQNH